MRGISVVGVVAIFLSSCLDDRETNIPFAFQEPRAGQDVWNTTKINLSIPNHFQGPVEISANGQVLATLTQEPYQFAWNTRLFTDGDYSLIAKAVDGGGNPVKAQVAVHIRNTLLVGVVPAQHIPTGSRGFIMINDALGKLIGLQELINNEPVALPGPESFDLPTFTVTEIYMTPPRLVNAFSVTEVKRGSWTLNQTHEPEYIGSIQVKSEEQPTGPYFVSTSGDFDFIDPENQTITLATTQATGNIFVREIGLNTNRYSLLSNIDAGSLLNVAMNSISIPLKKISVPITDPGVISARVQLYGFSQPNQFEEYYPLGYFFRLGSEVPIDYPAEFLYLGSESYYRNNEVRMYAFDPSKLYDFKTLNAQIYVTSNDQRTVDLATFGDFDIYMVSWSFYHEATNSSASWILIGPSGRSQKISLPEVPNEISSIVPTIKFKELQFTGVTQVSEYGVAKGYSEYLKYVSNHGIAGPYKLGLTWKEQLFTKSGRTAGKTQSEPLMLSEILKRVEPGIYARE